MSAQQMMRTSVRDAIAVVFRYKFSIVVIWALIAGGSVFLALQAGDVFESESELLVRLGRESISLDPSVTGPIVGMMQDRDAEVKSEIAIIESEYVIAKVVDTLGTDTIFGEGGWARPTGDDGGNPAEYEHKSAIKKIRDGLSVVAPQDTNIIETSFEAPSPEIAQRILSTLLEAYLERHIELFSVQASPEFFETQTDALLKELRDREQALKEFRTEHRIGAMDRQIDILLDEISQLYLQQHVGEFDDSPALATASEARIQVLEEAVKSRPEVVEMSRTTGLTNEAADAMKQILLDLELREQDLAARYQDDHRPLVELRDRIKQVKQTLELEKETRTTVTTGLDDGHRILKLNLEQEKADLEAHRARRAELAMEVERKEAELATFADLQLQHSSLERDVQVAEQEYLQYRENLHRAKISEALDRDKVSNVSIVQEATLPQAPVRPNRTLTALIGIVLGLGVALGYAFMIDFLDDAIDTPEDVQKHLDLPVLAVFTANEYRKCI